jgi:hypothetical protein
MDMLTKLNRVYSLYLSNLIRNISSVVEVYVCHGIEIHRVTKMMTLLMLWCIVTIFYNFMNTMAKSKVVTHAFYPFHNNQPPFNC